MKDLSETLRKMKEANQPAKPKRISRKNIYCYGCRERLPELEGIQFEQLKEKDSWKSDMLILFKFKCPNCNKVFKRKIGVRKFIL